MSLTKIIKEVSHEVYAEERERDNFLAQQMFAPQYGTFGSVKSISGTSLQIDTGKKDSSAAVATTKVVRIKDPVLLLGGRTM